MNIMPIIQELTMFNEFRLRNEWTNKWMDEWNLLNNLISFDDYSKADRHSCNPEKLTDEVEIGKRKFERLWLVVGWLKWNGFSQNILPSLWTISPLIFIFVNNFIRLFVIIFNMNEYATKNKKYTNTINSHLTLCHTNIEERHSIYSSISLSEILIILTFFIQATIYSLFYIMY